MTEQIAKVELDVPLWKNDAQQIVYGVVLEPNLEDSQGDIITPEEIEKAAHRYLVESRKQDVQHSTNPAAVYPVESYVAPHDMLLHGQLVKKGAWVLACKVADADVWKEIVEKGLTGYSIQGSGVRIPV